MRRTRDVLSALSPTIKCRNRRLPRITQRDDLPAAPIRLYPHPDLRTAGSFPGAACFCTFRPDLTLIRISRGRDRLAPKRLPPDAGQSLVASTCHALRGRG